MNIIHFIILYPVFLFGWIVGYFGRTFLRGCFGGFYYIELTERNKLSEELHELIDKKDEQDES